MNELQAHLVRVIAWAVVNLLMGVVLLARRDTGPIARAFAVQLVAWAAINLVLAAFGWDGRRPSPEFLWLNVGLDVGYLAVGTTMVLTGRRFQSPRLRGSGWGVLPQGLALFALDLYLVHRLGY